MTSIVIIAQSFPEPEVYSYWEPLIEPKCPFCGCPHMKEVRYDGDLEIWECHRCLVESEFYPGDYGEEEIEIPLEEWEAVCSVRRQRAYLEKRYGFPNPGDIRDYWMKPT